MHPALARQLLGQQSLHLDSSHSLLDALQEVFVFRVQVALLVGIHVGESAHVVVEVLLTDGLLQHRTSSVSLTMQ